MRLTKGQIEHVRRRVTDAPFPDGVYEHALAALDAYERVAALLERWDTSRPDRMMPMAEVREQMVEELRRAQDGDA